MQFSAVQRILGILLMLFSITMVPPLLVSVWYQDGAASAFVSALILTFLAGALLWIPVRKYRRELRLRDGFMIVVMFWGVLGLMGALPFMLAIRPDMSTTDSVFESISGLTTTGATVIVGLDLDQIWRVQQDTCGLNVFQQCSDGLHLISLNDVCHLSGVK